MKNLVAAILVVLTVNTFAANDEGKKSAKESTKVFSGIVYDSENETTLTGVQISIPELGIETYSDFDGKFELELPANAEYTIETNLISYRVEKIKIEKNQSKPLELKLGHL